MESGQVALAPGQGWGRAGNPPGGKLVAATLAHFKQMTAGEAQTALMWRRGVRGLHRQDGEEGLKLQHVGNRGVRSSKRSRGRGQKQETEEKVVGKPPSFTSEALNSTLVFARHP